MGIADTQQVGVTEIQDPDKPNCADRCRQTNRSTDNEHPSDPRQYIHTPFHRVYSLVLAIFGARRQRGTIENKINKVADAPIISGNPFGPQRSIA